MPMRESALWYVVVMVFKVSFLHLQGKQVLEGRDVCNLPFPGINRAFDEGQD